ncbi:copper resistance protein CopQ, partial [Cupriavidus sp. RAF12]
MNAKTILTAAALAAAFVTGAAQAATGEAYGYTYRVTDARSTFTDGARVNDARSTFTDGARVNDQRSPFTDGARVGKTDPYTDGARIVAGLDRTGVS